MIEEAYVSFETAKLLKDKGFNWEVHRSYLVNDNCFVPADVNDLPDRKDVIRIPTLQMAMKWLREKEWFICIIPLAFYCGEKAVKFGYNIWAGDNLEIDEFNTPKFRTYEEACEAAIKYCLENLI